MNIRALLVGAAVLWAVGAAVCPSQAAASDASGSQEPADLSGLLVPIVQANGVPALSAALIVGEHIAGIGASGLRRRDRPAVVTANDRFHIGSCTKAMTATLCAMLVEEGRLSWETTIEQAFPELRARMVGDYRQVTLQHLLTHRGGMPGKLESLELWNRLRADRGLPEAARNVLVEALVCQPLEALPGQRSIYSNAGFAVAGHMAERVTGQSWEELMRRRLFEPLKMRSAGFGAPGRDGLLDEPRGHTPAGQPVEPGPEADNPAAIAPAGAVHCSVPDWARFVAFHLRGSQGKSDLLGSAAFQKLHTPVPGDRYAMGWIVVEREWGGGLVLTHAGSNTLWFAVMWVAPRRDFAVVVACNQGGDAGERACDEAAWALIQHHLKRQAQTR